MKRTSRTTSPYLSSAVLSVASRRYVDNNVTTNTRAATASCASRKASSDTRKSPFAASQSIASAVHRLSQTVNNGRHKLRMNRKLEQACGGNPVNVFRGILKRESVFSFASRRQFGFPFSIVIYVDSVLDLRVSACCEYRHRVGSKLGGPKGHFVLMSVTGAFPCYRCQSLKTSFESEASDETVTHVLQNGLEHLSEQFCDTNETISNTESSSDYEDDFEDDDETTNDEMIGLTLKSNELVLNETEACYHDYNGDDGNRKMETNCSLNKSNSSLNFNDVDNSTDASEQLESVENAEKRSSTTNSELATSFKEAELPCCLQTFSTEEKEWTQISANQSDLQLTRTNQLHEMGALSDTTDEDDVVFQIDCVPDKQQSLPKYDRPGFKSGSQWTDYRSNHQANNSSDDEDIPSSQQNEKLTLTVMAQIHATESV